MMKKREISRLKKVWKNTKFKIPHFLHFWGSPKTALFGGHFRVEEHDLSCFSHFRHFFGGVPRGVQMCKFRGSHFSEKSHKFRTSEVQKVSNFIIFSSFFHHKKSRVIAGSWTPSLLKNIFLHQKNGQKTSIFHQI
jgi:hypothetical protein